MIEGQKTLDLANKTEIGASPKLTALHDGVVLGKLGRTTSFEEKDQLQLRECPIVYKRKSAGTPGRSGQFTSVASLTPRMYLDPNEASRHQAITPTIAKAGAIPNRSSDSVVETASRSSLR